MARRGDAQSFLVDLRHLGVVSISGPHTDRETGESFWNIEATDGAVAWVLAEAPSHVEAMTVQRRIFHSLATGENALNLSAPRRQATE